MRKYGFTFLTALLAAESVLVPTIYSKSGIAAGTVLPNSVKVAVLVINLLLIILLRLLDRNYQVFEDAATTRALVLERSLNLELTEIIKLRYDRCHVRRYVTYLYVAFVAGVYGLGWVVLYPDWLSIVVLSGFSATAFIFVGLIFGRGVSVVYPWGKFDWSISRLDCCSGEEIEITLTNLDEKPIVFEKDCVMWELRKEDSGESKHIEKIAHDITINKEDGYTWLFNDKNIDKGVYQIWRCVTPPKRSYRPSWLSTEDYEVSLYHLEKIKTIYNLNPDPDDKDGFLVKRVWPLCLYSGSLRLGQLNQRGYRLKR